MKSKTKFNVTDKMIRSIVSKHFPGESVNSIEELTEGMFNSAYALWGTGILKNGIVLKTSPAPGTELLTYEQAILRTETKVYELLKDSPVKIPKILACDFSHKEIPCDYFFMEHVKGILWKNCLQRISPESRRQLMYELGRRSAVASCENCLNEIKTPHLVDFDMWAGNIFIDEATCSHITGIIDFERSFFGDPAADFTSAMMLFDNVEDEPDFRKGYSEISNIPFKITDNDRIRMNLYRLYMAVILFVESYRYDEDYAEMIKGHLNKNIAHLLEELK